MIICFGDSNTYGYDPTEILGGRYSAEDRWPDILSEMLDEPVINYGMNGREIPRSETDISAVLQLFKLNHELNLLIIMLGTNDLLCAIPPSRQQVAQKMEHFISAVNQLIPDTAVLLLSPPDSGLGDLYRKIAAEHGIFFADTESWKLAMAYDGIHLTADANHTFAEKIYQVIKKIKCN